VIHVALNTHGTRAVQKLVETLRSPEQVRPNHLRRPASTAHPSNTLRSSGEPPKVVSKLSIVLLPTPLSSRGYRARVARWRWPIGSVASNLILNRHLNLNCPLKCSGHTLSLTHCLSHTLSLSHTVSHTLSLSPCAQVALAIEALAPGVVTLIKDLNGNHVVQRCLQRLSAADAQFIYDAAGAHCVEIATHRHGCCVLQVRSRRRSVWNLRPPQAC
jgi:hypothetical protein